MDKIIVQDGFLKKEEIKKCIEIINNKTWKYFHSSKSSRVGNYYWIMKLDDDEYLNTYIKNIIEKNFSKKFKIIKIYANGQTYGQDGGYHVDTLEENRYTFCLYLTDIKEENIETAGGHLYFDIPNLKYKICYEPIFNRGIFFPSNYFHMAKAFSRYIMDLRIVLVWKLEKIL